MIWEIDSTLSEVSFSVRVLSVTVTKGHFTSLRGRLSVDEVNPSNSWVQAEVDASGIDTGNRLRDAHLRSSSFFAVKRYPTITFQSTGIAEGEHFAYSLAGNLTLRGITKSVTFAIERATPITGSGTSGPYMLTAQGTINRHDFDLGQGWLVRFAAGQMVDIEITMVAVQHAVEPGEAVVTAE